MRIALISTAAAAAVLTAAVLAPSQAEASIASPVLGTIPQTVDPIEKAGCYRSGAYGYRWYPWCGGGYGGWRGGGRHGGHGFHGGGWHGGHGFHGGFHGGRGRR